MEKISAVEWLVENILTKIENYGEDGEVDSIEFWNAFVGATDLSEFVNKAKEMEKDQIIKAHGIKTSTGYNGINWLYKVTAGEDYYNETYKSE